MGAEMCIRDSYTVTPILFLFSMTAFALDRAGPRLTHPAAPRVLAGLLLGATWIADYAPINQRSLGPAWDSQLRSARERCIREPDTPASVVIAPSARLAVSGQQPAARAWKVDLDCELL